ncbi:hypothetical protein LINGRAHAP2_LOCUS20373, partial [Linum grandiflorum]
TGPRPGRASPWFRHWRPLRSLNFLPFGSLILRNRAESKLIVRIGREGEEKLRG